MHGYKKNNSRLKRFFLILFSIVLCSFVSIILYKMYEKIEIHNYDIEGDYIAEKTSQIKENGSENNTHITDIIEDVTSSVVGISKLKDMGSTIFLNNNESSLGLGTGIIVTENGYILSNEHVTGEKFSNCYVTLKNGKTYTADVVWSDSSIDLSIIKINMKGLKFTNLGDSNSVKVGETVYAIGNPIGYEFQRTVTSGIISAIDRTVKIEENEKVTYMDDLIQTDATINPGNSGGPLINEDGLIIGINTVKITTAEGIGFAVPINIVKPIIERYMKDEKFEEASLGIFAYDKNIIPYIDEKNNIKKGIYIAQISIDSPAYRNGLKIGDVISRIDDIELNKMSDLRSYIYTKSPGDEVELTIYRNRKEEKLQIKLGTK